MATSLRSIRQELKWSQLALASAARVPLQHLKRWERGLDAVPQAAIERLAAALGYAAPDLELILARDHAATQIGEGYVTARNAEELILPRRQPSAANRIRVLDLFCGSGG